MASFMTDLWSSIFTPGTTPTLLVATNATFATLQVLLLALLYATHSIHFLVLSGLCGALWWSINWFVAEMNAAKATQLQEKQTSEHPANTGKEPLIRPPGALDTTESETETESLWGGGEAKVSSTGTSASFTTGAKPRRGPPLLKRESTPAASKQQPSPVATQDIQSDLKQQNTPHDSSGYLSTDSEWEKVEEDR